MKHFLIFPIFLNLKKFCYPFLKDNIKSLGKNYRWITRFIDKYIDIIKYVDR